MKINEIRAKAKGLGLKIALGMKKADIIRAIQTREGNTPCFQTDPEHCGQTGCLWRKDCMDALKK